MRESTVVPLSRPPTRGEPAQGKWFNVRQTCPICRSLCRETLVALPYAEPPVKNHLDSWYSYDPECIKEGDYRLDECQRCGLIYQREILNEQAMAQLYNEWIDYHRLFERNKNKHTSDRGIAQAQELVNVCLYFGTTPGKLKVLDFGMGFGTWCYLAKGLGCQHVYGTELSQTRTAYAKDITLIDWEALPHYQFDFIHTEQVFEHLPHPLETLIHLSNALSPGGVIKISVPDGKGIKEKLKAKDWQALRAQKLPINSREIWGQGAQNTLNAVAPLEHINCFNYDVLLKMAERAGLSPVVLPNKRVVLPTDNYKIRSLLKPYYHLLANLFPSTIKARKTTHLFFKKKEEKNPSKS
jgi:2-polyprenyl-3-methyl-5-hydroxy-6-metoxy-1,4-benzoquinol methylase